MNRQNISSGSTWEPLIGYSRAVRVGDYVYVSGTTGGGEEGLREQTQKALQTIEAALKEAGAELKHVVRTRIYLTDISQWEIAGKIHGEFFGSVRPATTMVEVSKLISPELLIEIEADAYLG